MPEANIVVVLVLSNLTELIVSPVLSHDHAHLVLKEAILQRFIAWVTPSTLK